ncbi:unnamed protein product [Colletotrichum noveboracense]|uniref:Uncharacterized protein n=1 Tax=Colletotrichum noveboracense TaxID=2664923 RepID=A0A9W4WA86_9PEZI|nr:unnamed protein product [Colletotrichum noveboracense]
MGNKQSAPQRRNTDNAEKQLLILIHVVPCTKPKADTALKQYRTNHGVIPVANVPRHLEDAPPPFTETRSGFPHEYRNNEGQEVRTQPFANFVTGPNRAQGPAGQLHEYTIPGPNTQFRFDYDRRCINARQANRPIHPNERANVMGPANGAPRNDPQQMRAAVRVARVNGKEETVVVGVMDHPEGEQRMLQRAPFEPISRQGRQAMERETDEKGRSRTYPPRGVDAAFVQDVEAQYRKVNPPAHPEMRANPRPHPMQRARGAQ